MLNRIVKLEGDRYLGIEPFGTLRGKVPGCIEYQPVNTGLQGDFFRNEIRNSAVRVGCALSN